MGAGKCDSGGRLDGYESKIPASLAETYQWHGHVFPIRLAGQPKRTSSTETAITGLGKA
ncbi:hypothetical protein KIN20_026875 [Parelaphostrongylus tenuis]|uniref:Uncharacterized protein n=1 Tax=Parelaphostrongylus tenuis TaxID=148309 RepID=A0AAD5WDA5_PARTN|nr:hypothetical protein KIN20_026875 [Parelaphostrongylus tenuis]